jgi:eukaryotic-like serine/threonine-protein kinase
MVGCPSLFLAEDLKHHRRVAIKLLKPELSPVLGSERFLREIERRTPATLRWPPAPSEHTMKESAQP